MQVNDVLQWVLTFLGTGVLSSYLTYLIMAKREKREDKKMDNASQQQFINDIYKEIGRLQNEVGNLRVERDDVHDELIELKEKYVEAIKDNQYLREKIAELMEENQELRDTVEQLLKFSKGG